MAGLDVVVTKVLVKKKKQFCNNCRGVEGENGGVLRLTSLALSNRGTKVPRRLRLLGTSIVPRQMARSAIGSCDFLGLNDSERSRCGPCQKTSSL